MQAIDYKLASLKRQIADLESNKRKMADALALMPKSLVFCIDKTFKENPEKVQELAKSVATYIEALVKAGPEQTKRTKRTKSAYWRFVADRRQEEEENPTGIKKDALYTKLSDEWKQHKKWKTETFHKYKADETAAAKISCQVDDDEDETSDEVDDEATQLADRE